MDLWQQVLIETKNKAKMHLGLSDNVSNNIVNRFMIISDDCQRISKQVTPQCIPSTCNRVGVLLTISLVTYQLEHTNMRRTLCHYVCCVDILIYTCIIAKSVHSRGLYHAIKYEIEILSSGSYC